MTTRRQRTVLAGAACIFLFAAIALHSQNASPKEGTFTLLRDEGTFTLNSTDPSEVIIVNGGTPFALYRIRNNGPGKIFVDGNPNLVVHPGCSFDIGKSDGSMLKVKLGDGVQATGAYAKL